MTATQNVTSTTYTHILHFTNYSEMGYAFTHLDCFVVVADSSENEFDGDAEFEVVFTTLKKIPQTTIKKSLLTSILKTPPLIRWSRLRPVRSKGKGNEQISHSICNRGSIWQSHI
jgi:hypothetical protein